MEFPWLYCVVILWLHPLAFSFAFFSLTISISYLIFPSSWPIHAPINGFQREVYNHETDKPAENIVLMFPEAIGCKAVKCDVQTSDVREHFRAHIYALSAGPSLIFRFHESSRFSSIFLSFFRRFIITRTHKSTFTFFSSFSSIRSESFLALKSTLNFQRKENIQKLLKTRTTTTTTNIIRIYFYEKISITPSLLMSEKAIMTGAWSFLLSFIMISRTRWCFFSLESTSNNKRKKKSLMISKFFFWGYRFFSSSFCYCVVIISYK